MMGKSNMLITMLKQMAIRKISRFCLHFIKENFMNCNSDAPKTWLKNYKIHFCRQINQANSNIILFQKLNAV